MSPEFLKGLPSLLLTAFPEIQRNFFVHIPKTGGTTLRKMAERHLRVLVWNEGIGDNEWFTFEPEFYGPQGESFILRFLAQFGGDNCPPFFYGGHVTLPKLIASGLIRPRDRIVAVIRDPLEILRSAINYTFTIANGADRPDATDWRSWIRSIDENWTPGSPPDKKSIIGLAKSRRFRETYSNVISRFLSTDGTAQGALDAIEISGCTVIPIEEIDMYARNELGIRGSLAHENRSIDYIEMADAFDMDLEEELRQMCSLDRELVARLRGDYRDAPVNVIRHARELRAVAG